MCIYNSKSSASAGEEQCLKVVVTELKSPALIKPLDTQQESPHKPGEKLQSALKVAHDENRVIIGVPSAVKYLSATPEDTLFCILAPPKMDDSAAHIQEVLLKAFCFENDIYVIEVDSAAKFGRVLNENSAEVCALIQKSRRNNEEVISPVEESLIDFCEEYWNAQRQPIVQLPDT